MNRAISRGKEQDRFAKRIRIHSERDDRKNRRFVLWLDKEIK